MIKFNKGMFKDALLKIRDKSDSVQDKGIIAAALLLVVIIGASLYFAKYGTASAESIRQKTENYINEKLVAPGMKISIKEITKESGLYKIKVISNDQEYTSYVSKDGKKLFVDAIDLGPSDSPGSSPDEQANQKQDANQTAPKTDVPEVKLFVMSYCPYGLQAEKGILPAVELLGSKIKFDLKFVNYAMHGETEVQENLRQYCIQKQNQSKLMEYLKCFNAKSDSNACLSQTKVDLAALNSCVSSTDAQFKVMEKAKNKSELVNGQFPPFGVDDSENKQYNVSGSPTLVINGTQISVVQRDPQGFLNAICAAFSNQPQECGSKISQTAPAPGFDNAK